MYFELFSKANRLTQELGMPGVELASPSVTSYLRDPGFIPKIASLMNIDEPEELAAKCNIVSQVVCEAISLELDCKAYLTIGDVELSGGSLFKVDETYIRSLIAGGKKSLVAQRYRHHAWITLESMEIIDFTLNTSLSLFAKDLTQKMRQQLLGGIAEGHADHLKGGVSFLPILVGEAFYLEYDSLYSSLKSIYKAGLKAKPMDVRSMVRLSDDG